MEEYYGRTKLTLHVIIPKFGRISNLLHLKQILKRDIHVKPQTYLIV